MARVVFTVICYWALLIAFGVVTIGDSWDVIPVTIFAAGAFAAVIMGVTASVKNEDYFMTVLNRMIIMPMFLFSGTFFPLSSMPIFIQPIGWISPLWHATELGRYYSYGYPISFTMLVIHFGYLIGMMVVGFKLANKKFAERLAK
jgi:lipooligosaccharide transport system permease protein